MKTGSVVTSRRSLLKFGVGVVATVATGSSVLLRSVGKADAGTLNVNLFINAGFRTMIDGTQIYVVGFGSAADRVEMPGGTLEVAAGDQVAVAVTNSDSRPHTFSIAGVVSSASIAPGTSATVRFTAPAAGSYFYTSTQLDPVDRALGLYGAMLLYPPGGRPSPGRHALPLTLDPDVAVAVQRRFADGLQITRDYTWLLSDLDSRVNDAARLGSVPSVGGYLANYFFINGLSGVLAVEDENTALRGSVGDRTLLRMINVGLLPRSIHMHGNHFVILTHPDAPWLLGTEKDTVRIPPGGIVDVLVPFEAPGDAWPPVQRGQHYVVHDHIEMAQTANGGLYPAGMISEVTFE